MFVLEIIPIQKGIPFDTLSYFSTDLVALGTLVEIPFNRNFIHGIVVSSEPLSNVKSKVKGSPFALKKIKRVVSTADFFREITTCLVEVSNKTLIPVGALAGTIFSNNFFEFFNLEKIENTPLNPKIKHTKQAIIGSYHNRLDQYKRMTRTIFAENNSLLFIVPTIFEVERWAKDLEKGIARHIIKLHSKMTKKDLRLAYTQLKQKDLPILLITTANYACIPKNEFTTIILESEQSNAYQTMDRFHIDMKLLLTEFAQVRNIPIYYGGILPSFETLVRTNMTSLPRSYTPEKLTVLPVERANSTLPKEIIELVKYAKQNSKRVFIYTNRKNVAPLSMCRDCGEIVRCPDCKLPVVLKYKKIGEETVRVFTCSYCKKNLATDTMCDYCQGWNISPLSIGTESIRDELLEFLAPEQVITIDDNLTPDNKEIESLIQNTDKKKFVVFVGTQKILPFIKEVDFCTIPFFDRIVSIPSFTTIEQTLRLILECNSFTRDEVVICTKNPEFPFTKMLTTQKINAIIDEELTLRQELGYPPYGVLYKILIQSKENTYQQIQKNLKETLDQNGFENFFLSPKKQLDSFRVDIPIIIKTTEDFFELHSQVLKYALDRLELRYSIERNPEKLL